MDTFYVNVTEMDRVFFQGRCRQIQFTASDGMYGVMAHHENAVIAVYEGALRIQKEDGTWLEGVTGAGFLQIIHNRALMIVDTVERPEDIDRKRAQDAYDRAREQLRQKNSMIEYELNKANLARAMARLKMTSQYGDRK